MIRWLLSNAVQEWLIDHVLTQYQQGKITIGRAARMVEIPLREMIAIASKKGIPFQYSIGDLRACLNILITDNDFSQLPTVAI